MSRAWPWTFLAVAGKPLAGEGAEALARVFVGAEPLLVGVLRVGGDLFRDGTHFAVERVVVLRVTQKRLDPRLVCFANRQILFEQKLPEQEPDADVRECAKRKDPMRGADEPV